MEPETLKIGDDFGDLGLKVRTILIRALKMKYMRMYNGVIRCKMWLG
jgi:hypothetical protein